MMNSLMKIRITKLLHPTPFCGTTEELPCRSLPSPRQSFAAWSAYPARFCRTLLHKDT